MMNEKPTSVEGRIISATIDCIEKYGISGATNRQIAQMAEVNIAAINYYFRSKDVLIQRCMEITLKNAFDLSDIPPMPGVPAQERCIAILIDLIQGGYQYPGITRSHFYNLLAEGRSDLLLVEHVNRFITELVADLHDRGCALALDEMRLAIVQIVSAVFLAILAPDLFETRQGINLRDPQACRAYVTRLVSKLLG